jgi:hypothetical protein
VGNGKRAITKNASVPPPLPPSYDDARILLKLNDLYQSDRIFRGWAFSQQEFNAESWHDLLEKYPWGSEGFNHFYSVGHFLEVCGVLMKYGLLNEDLFFDTFWFEPIWKNYEPVIMSMRKEFNEPSIEENFEFLYKRYLQWKKLSRKKRS